MNPLGRPILLGAAVAIVATAGMWLSIIQDALEDAVEDGFIAWLIALVVSRRSKVAR